MAEAESSRTWPRDVAILLLAMVIGGGIFYLVAGRDDTGGGATVAGDSLIGDVQPGQEGEDGPDDPELQVEEGAGADVEVVAPEDAGDPETAVASFLAAEVERDFDASFAYLTADIQSRLNGNPQQWRAEHRQFPTVTGFEVLEVTERDGDPVVRTALALDSKLDPVVGLIAARAEAFWVYEETDDGFRVDYDESFLRQLYPTDDGARDVALAWAEAVRDGDAPGDLQGVKTLYGPQYLEQELVTGEGVFDVGDPVSLPPDGGSSDLVSAFGAEVVGWARAVPLGGAADVTVVLAPIEDEWRVIGLIDPARG